MERNTLPGNHPLVAVYIKLWCKIVNCAVVGFYRWSLMFRRHHFDVLQQVGWFTYSHHFICCPGICIKENTYRGRISFWFARIKIDFKVSIITHFNGEIDSHIWMLRESLRESILAEFLALTYLSYLIPLSAPAILKNCELELMIQKNKIIVSPFHNPLAMLHALALLIAHMGQGLVTRIHWDKHLLANQQCAHLLLRLRLSRWLCAWTV